MIARVEDRALRVEVRDNGARGARPDGSGLVGMADRLSVIDGRLRVDSPVGGGTLVSAHIPLPEQLRQRVISLPSTRQSAEVAVTVADDWQGRGLGWGCSAVQPTAPVSLRNRGAVTDFVVELSTRNG